MTLCKYRPQRTYDEQFIFDGVDVRGMLKALERGSTDAERGTYYAGALIAFEVLFDTAANEGKCDIWTDFIETFDIEIGAEIEKRNKHA